MKAIIKTEKTVQLRTIIVRAEVRYWEDAEINDKQDTEKGDNIPCKKGIYWCPEINISTGIITNWEQGKKASIHYKVCDCFSWEIKDEDHETILSAENEYVPETFYPKEDGFGDYIIMDIDTTGKILNWKFNLSDFNN